MHAIDQIFARPNDQTACRKEAVSIKKLNKGDGGWNQCKEILGWILDTEHWTIKLTEQQKLRVWNIFDEL